MKNNALPMILRIGSFLNSSGEISSDSFVSSMVTKCSMLEVSEVRKSSGSKIWISLKNGKVAILEFRLLMPT